MQREKVADLNMVQQSIDTKTIEMQGKTMQTQYDLKRDGAAQNMTQAIKYAQENQDGLTKQIDKAEDSRLSSSLVGIENPNTKKRKDHQE